MRDPEIMHSLARAGLSLSLRVPPRLPAFFYIKNDGKFSAVFVLVNCIWELTLCPEILKIIL